MVNPVIEYRSTIRETSDSRLIYVHSENPIKPRFASGECGWVFGMGLVIVLLVEGGITCRHGGDAERWQMELWWPPPTGASTCCTRPQSPRFASAWPKLKKGY